MNKNQGIITSHTPSRQKNNLHGADFMHTANQKSKTLNRKFVKKPNFSNNINGASSKSIDGMTTAAKPNTPGRDKSAQNNFSKKPLNQKPRIRQFNKFDGLGASTKPTIQPAARPTINTTSATLAERQPASANTSTRPEPFGAHHPVSPPKPQARIIKKPTLSTRLANNPDNISIERTELSVIRSATHSRFSGASVRITAPLNRQSQPVVQPIPRQKPRLNSQPNLLQHDVDYHIEHPIARSAQNRQASRQATNQAPVLKTAREIKEEVIAETLAAAPNHHKKQVKPPTLWGKAKLIGGLSAGLISAMILTYAAYTHIPSLSIGVVNARVGVQANYPGYIPDGYRIDGPISGQDGQVQINFKSTTNDTSFKLIQVNSTWDSDALLSNYVKEKSNNHYQTDTERGIVIYSFSHGGAWMNGGILHVVEGTAQLNPEQIKRMAISL